MVSLEKMLDDHEVATRARVERLRGELERVTAELSAAQEALSRVEITRATLREVVAGDVARGGGSAGCGGPDRDGVGAVVVPAWRQGLTPVVLPEGYRPLWAALCAAGGQVRARALALEIGLEPSPSRIEGVRSRLKKLVARGWVTESSPGLFAARA